MFAADKVARSTALWVESIELLGPANDPADEEADDVLADNESQNDGMTCPVHGECNSTRGSILYTMPYPFSTDS